MDWQRFIPGFWMQNCPTSLEWDEALNTALDANKITKISQHTVCVNGMLVWTSNWPYAYGSPHSPEVSILPKVSTRKRLMKAVLNAAIAEAVANQEQPQ